MADKNKYPIPNPLGITPPVTEGGLTGEEPMKVIKGAPEAADAVTGRPVRAAALTGLTGQPFSETYASGAPGEEVAKAFLNKTEELGMPLRAPGQEAYGIQKPLGMVIDVESQLPAEAIGGMAGKALGKALQGLTVKKGPEGAATIVGPGGRNLDINKVEQVINNMEQSVGQVETNRWLKQWNPDYWEYKHGNATPELQKKLKLTSKDLREASDEADKAIPLRSTEETKAIPTGTPEDQNFAEGGIATPTAAPAAAPTPQQPESVNVINPEGSLVSIPTATLGDALDLGYKPATQAHIDHYVKEQKYGTVGQQIKTGLEGAAQGVAGPIATAIEVAAGVKPTDIRGRQEVNPNIHTATETGAFVGSALLGVGEAAALAKAGEAAGVGLAKAGLKGGFAKTITNDAIKGAFEMALMQAGEEGNKLLKQDPNQTANSAIADIGLAGVMGGVFGGATGAALRGAKKLAGFKEPFVSELDQAGLQSGDFKTVIDNSSHITPAEKEGIFAGLAKEKANAPELRDIGKRNGWPILEAHVSDSNVVQKAVDSFINGAPTPTALAVSDQYNKAFSMMASDVDSTLGKGSQYSAAELGNIQKESLSTKIRQQEEPIAALYDSLKMAHEVIPISEKAAPAIAANIKKMPELRLSPRSPAGQLANNVIRDLENVKTVDDLKQYKTIFRNSVPPTASSGEKNVRDAVLNKLKELEERSIVRFAKTVATTPEEKAAVMDLITDRNIADSEYKKYITKVGTLAEKLGKRRITGTEDALSFINDLTPEEITRKLFSKKDSEFLKFFSKEFPDQFKLMQDYQKGALRDAASKTGTLVPKTLFTELNKLEPEIQSSIFSKEELSKLTDAETYLQSFPKNFNPSGTSGMTAFREALKHPVAYGLASAADYGINKFIKAVSASPEVNQAVGLAKATIRGEKIARDAVKAVVSGGKTALPAALAAGRPANVEKLKKIVDQYQQDPSKMLGMNDSNPLPSYAQNFAETSARAVQYLSSIKPNTAPQAPLDKKMVASNSQQQEYDRQLRIAEQPLTVLKHMKDGRLTPTDMRTIRTIYPDLYQSLSTKFMDQMTDAMAKKQSIPYATKMQMSMFLGQPLDSTLTTQGILAAQSRTALGGSSQQQAAPQQGVKKSASALNKLPGSMMTPNQARQMEKSQGK